LVAIAAVAGVVLWQDASNARSGPLSTSGASYKATTGVRPGRRLDYASLVVVNQSKAPATIDELELLAGGDGTSLMEDVEFFVLGLERSIDGGGADAPTESDFWGVAPVPAIGYEIPGSDVDVEGKGVNILIRAGPGYASSGSFDGVDIHYTWQGDSYVLRSGASMLLCKVGRDFRMPPPCRPGSKAPVVGGDPPPG
jgi:hypothetical protein